MKKKTLKKKSISIKKKLVSKKKATPKKKKKGIKKKKVAVIKKKTTVIKKKKESKKKKSLKEKDLKNNKETKSLSKSKLPIASKPSEKKVNNRLINPSHYQAKKVKKVLEIKAIKEKKVKKIFSTKDYVVYPTHGVGCVIDIEKREVVGQNLEMYVIEFIRDKLVLRVPVEKAKALNLRKVSKPSKIQSVMKILAQKARIKRTMWSRRAQEYDQKINSGDIEQIAEVVRDLNRANNQIEQSYSERQLFELAYDRFLREVIAGLNIPEENAIKKVDKVLGRDKIKKAPLAI
jgi:CarD family transcriptional regulator|tara:strand:+ start:354 stop:1223 length:870 start_codon:yes stop_codon:yes gene_type:complete